SPALRRTSARVPPRAGEDERGWPLPHRGQESANRGELLVAPDDSLPSHRLRHSEPPTARLRPGQQLCASCQARISTTPESASTRNRSPVLMTFVAEPVPTTAGSPYSRATMAA